MQELRDLVAQLRAENERLRQEQAAAVPGSSAIRFYTTYRLFHS